MMLLFLFKIHRKFSELSRLKNITRPVRSLIVPTLLYSRIRIVRVLVLVFSIEQIGQLPTHTQLPQGGHELTQDLVRLFRHGEGGKHLN